MTNIILIQANRLRLHAYIAINMITAWTMEVKKEKEKKKCLHHYQYNHSMNYESLYYYYYVEQLNLKNNKRIGPDYRVCLDTIRDYIKED